MSKARDLANAGTALTSVTPTELGYLDGVTSAVQTQINNVLPSQTGNSGKYLTTDGSTKSWGTVSQYSLPSMTGKAGKYLTTDGTVESWADAARSTEIFDLTANTREWLDSGFTSTGNYNVVLSAGTGYLWTYATNGDLLQEFEISTTASIAVVTTAFARLVAVGTSNADLSITPAPAKITSAKALALDVITGTGNYSAGSGNATGGSSGYVAGQVAHVVVVGGGGGGGGASNGYPWSGGGSGGAGGVAFTTSPITLTGTYSLTVGSAGAGGNNSEPGQTGGTGNGSSGFGLTTNGGTGGQGGYYIGSGYSQPGTDGTPAISTDTPLYKPTTYAKLGAGNPGSSGGQYYKGLDGGSGKIFILRWTP